MRIIITCSFIFLCFVWASSCSNETSQCTPGVTQRCYCVNAAGVQICKDDGSGWKACDCGSTSPEHTTLEPIKDVTTEKPSQDRKPEPVTDAGNPIVDTKPDPDTKANPDTKLTPDTRPDPDTKPDPDTRPAPDTKPDPDTKPTPDYNVTPDLPSPNCSSDSDCGNGEGCLNGYCRNKCLLGFLCTGMPSGPLCHQKYCVKCRTDTDCKGSQESCHPQSFTCYRKGKINPNLTKFGLFYSLWHCPIVKSKPIYDISEILAGRQKWGPLWRFHYWDEPAPGYYCLSQNDPLLKKHAIDIRDAGVNFVFLDVTNHNYVGSGSDRTKEMILKPLDRMLAVWSQVPNAPKIVPWVPISNAGTDPNKYTIDAIIQRMNRYPSLYFKYLGKPLILVTENSVHKVNTSKYNALANKYTMRKMWGVFSSQGPSWSFLQACKNSPTASQLCDQRSAYSQGKLEQVSVSVAYQSTYMSISSATPKHKGKTFRKQFETAFRNPEVPIVTITGWNEWIAQRNPCGKDPTCPCSKYPNGCFVDQWDIEYSRDIEPAKNSMGDYYYRLMKACIGLFRKGESCTPANASNLCCKDYQP